jgi:hypothetical protein
MPNPLNVCSSVSIVEGCEMRYVLHTNDMAEFRCGGHRDNFDFTFDAGALRAFLLLGTRALQEMEEMA